MTSTEFNFEDVEDVYNKINMILCSSAHKIIGKSKGARMKKAVLWWTEKFSEAIKIRNRALRKVKKSHSFDDFINYKRTQAEVRKVIRKLL